MKKSILFLVIVILIIGSLSYARYYDVNEHIFGDDDLPFSDLLEPVLDDRGRQLLDGSPRQPVFVYNRFINEILKASKITIDKDGNKLIVGYNDGTFRPNDPVTKGEFIKMAIGLSVNRNFDFSAFKNSGINHWSGPYVAVAQMQNVVEEGDYSDLNLNEPMTRLEMILILSKIQINMKGVSKYVEGTLPNYSDISTLTDEEKGYLLHAARYELIEDMLSSDEIKPYNNITRAEAARAIIRVY